MKYLGTRPWMASVFVLVIVCIGGLVNSSNKPLAAVLYGLALVSSVGLGVIMERSYRRKRREPQR